MVTVFRGPRDAGGGGNLPEYRLFDIRSQSVYDLLGIQSADVLVAAHGFIVYDPNSFPTYALSFISQVEKPSIEIKRAGVPMLLNYEFVP
jgi:type II secretory pathway component PulC